MSSITDYKDFNAAKYMIDQYGSGQRKLGDSYDIDFYAPNAPVTMKSEGPSGGEIAANVGTSAAAGSAGGVAGAGIAAGGALLTSYLAQKAADERQRRQNAAAIEQNYAQNQTNAYNTILGNLGKALR